MVDEALDLWPEIRTTKDRTPYLILKQQAALLGKHTSNLLQANVLTQPSGDRLLHRFVIDVPTIGYRLELFAISHDIELYPVRVESSLRIKGVSIDMPIASEAALVDWLRAVLNSPETKRMLDTLLTQAESQNRLGPPQ